MDYRHLFSTLFAVGGTLFSFLIGDWTTALNVLVLFMVLDYLTGVVSAVINKQANSKECKEGIFKKAGMFVVIILAHRIDAFTPESYPVLKTMVCYFYIGGEGISILENLNAMNVPIPAVLVQALNQLSSKSRESSNKEEKHGDEL